MDILVIDQCSGSKAIPDGARELTKAEVDQFRSGQLPGDGIQTVAAEALYTGRQQQHISQAIETLRAKGHSVDRKFISAGFGLVPTTDQLPPYNVTFSAMSTAERRQRGDRLGIAKDVRDLLTIEEYDLMFFAIGKTYADVLELEEAIDLIPETTTVVLFSQPQIATGRSNVGSVPAGPTAAKDHNATIIELKGDLLQNFARNIGSAGVPDSVTAIEECCMRHP